MAAAQSSALFCGFRAFLILHGYYPPDLARRFRPFVDLLLTRLANKQEPRGRRGVMHCSYCVFWLRGQDLNL